MGKLSESERAMNTLTGTIIEIGTCPSTGLVRVIVETTEDNIRDLSLNHYGRRVQINLLDARATTEEMGPYDGWPTPSATLEEMEKLK